MTGRRKNSAPEFPVKGKPLAPLGSQDTDRNMHKMPMQIADKQPRETRHRRMHGMTPHSVAENGILGIGLKLLKGILNWLMS